MNHPTSTKPLKCDRDHQSMLDGGRTLDKDDHRGSRKKGRSASGELDDPMEEPRAPIFEVVADTDDDLPEFEPVHPGQAHVEWDDGEDYEMAEGRFESLVDELFSDIEDEEAMAVFEEVMGALGWSDGEVIWEGMDFDQMFTDPGQFHDFELLSRKDQRKFLRERLRTQQASLAADASDDGEIEMITDPPPKERKAVKTPKPRSPGQLVSYETETEHRPQELDIGINTDRKKRRKKG